MRTEKLIPTKVHNPCPVCGDTSGDCRTKGELILCHSFPSGGGPGFKFIRSSVDGVWGVYLDQPLDLDRAEIERRKLIQQQKREARLDAQYQKWASGLTRSERDRSIRRLATLGLKPEHKELLKQRGLTDPQIEESLFFSVSPGLKIPGGVSPKLPGVSKGAIATKKTGYACIAFDHQGQAIGYQIRDENPSANSKYSWVKGDFPSHLQNGELPLSVAGQVTDAVLLCEGTLKPRIASYRFGGIRFIGASGGHFAGSPLQLKAAIGSCRRVILCPDAGDVLNPHVIRRWDKTLDLFNHNYQVQVAWWGQATKEHPDIDEISSWDGVQFLSPQDWQKVTTESQNSLE